MKAKDFFDTLAPGDTVTLFYRGAGWALKIVYRFNGRRSASDDPYPFADMWSGHVEMKEKRTYSDGHTTNVYQHKGPVKSLDVPWGVKTVNQLRHYADLSASTWALGRYDYSRVEFKKATKKGGQNAQAFVSESESVQ